MAIESRYGRHWLPSDPVEIVHDYPAPENQELAGVLAAGLAFGNAQAVRASTRAVLDRLGPDPVRTVARDRRLAETLDGTGHRWIRAPDIAAALKAVVSMQQRKGSLERAFLSFDRTGESDFSHPMTRLVDAIPELRPFFSSPARGSACKRYCMFLRWMIRPADGIDLGLWRELPPSRLTVPLDVHLARLGRRLGLLTRRSDDWKAARELTRALGSFDEADPLRFDFALCRLGMEESRRRRSAPRR